ncbi:MAG: hypothetical protein ACRDRT_12065 [Pseudonocardiaceae bacterium]
MPANNVSKIQTRINKLNLGTSEHSAGDFIVGNLAGAQAVAPIATPGTATAAQCATAFNALIAALNTHTAS